MTQNSVSRVAAHSRHVDYRNDLDVLDDPHGLFIPQ